MADEPATDHLPDGSAISYEVHTDDPAVAAVFAADLQGRLRQARRTLISAMGDRAVARFAANVPATEEACRSTETYRLPTGEATVTIDANGRAAHGYLRYLVDGAVAYTDVIDVDAGPAAAIGGLLLTIGVGLAVLVHPFVGAPFVGAAGVMLASVALYLLSVNGHPVSLSRVPTPTDPGWGADT